MFDFFENKKGNTKGEKFFSTLGDTSLNNSLSVSNSAMDKLTFKDLLKDNNENSAANILYGDTRRKEEEEKKRRGELLRELGDNLTPAQILYSSINDLEKIKQNQENKNNESLENLSFKKTKGHATGAASEIENNIEIEEDSSETNTTNEIVNNEDANNKNNILDINNNENIENKEPKVQDFDSEKLKGGIVKNSIIDNSTTTKKDSKTKTQSKKEMQTPNTNFKTQTKNIETNSNNSLSKTTKAEISNDKHWLIDRISNSKEPASEIVSIAKSFGMMNQAAEKIVFDTLKQKGIDAAKNIVKKIVYQMNPDTIAKIVGPGYFKFFNLAAKKVYGRDAAGMLDISHENIKDKSYIKDATKLTGYADKRIAKYRDYLEGKIGEQFKHYKHIKKENVGGYYFPPHSEPSQNMAKDKYMLDFVKNNKDNILNKKKGMSLEFKTGNMYYAHHFVDVVDCWVNENGDVEILTGDTNDYNEGEDNKLVQGGNIAMKDDKLIPLFVIKHVTIPKEQVEKLWGKGYNQ